MVPGKTRRGIRFQQESITTVPLFSLKAAVCIESSMLSFNANCKDRLRFFSLKKDGGSLIIFLLYLNANCKDELYSGGSFFRNSGSKRTLGYWICLKEGNVGFLKKTAAKRRDCFGREKQ